MAERSGQKVLIADLPDGRIATTQTSTRPEQPRWRNCGYCRIASTAACCQRRAPPSLRRSPRHRSCRRRAFPEHRARAVDQRIDHRGVVDFVDVLLVVDQRVDGAEALGERIGQPGLGHVHQVSDQQFRSSRPRPKSSSALISSGTSCIGNNRLQNFGTWMNTAAQREHRQNRERRPHHRRRFVRMRVAAILAEEGHEHGARTHRTPSCRR